MSIIKTALVAASLIAIAGVSANADSRRALESGFHGNTSASQAYAPADRQWIVSPAARGAFAQDGVVRQRIQAHDANPLIDDFHGNTER